MDGRGTRRSRPSRSYIEGVAPTTQGDNLQSFPHGKKFSDIFFVDQVYPPTDGQKRRQIQQLGLLTTSKTRYGFTSYANFYLEPGSTYLLKGVVSEPSF